eukprot:7616254-Alexandrium_andersonii.AAC.1
MSASLVGSEMCIRDRPGAHRGVVRSAAAGATCLLRATPTRCPCSRGPVFAPWGVGCSPGSGAV